MQPNETLKPRTPSPHQEVSKEWVDRVKQSVEPEKRSLGEKLKTAVGDTIRDIATANKMAVDTLEKTAFKYVLEGSVTTLIGVGLERVLEDKFIEATRVGGEGVLLDRPWMQFSEKTRQEIQGLKKVNPRLYHFVFNAAKDLATGVVYNGLAFFSRPMLKSVSGGHLVSSLAIDAADAWGSKGLDTEIRDRANQESNYAVQQDKFMKDSLAKEKAVNTKVSLIQERTQLYNRLFDINKMQTKIGADEKVVADIKSRIHALDNELYRIPNSDSLLAEDQLRTIPVDPTVFGEQSKTIFRKLINSSNPATLLGIDMIIDGGATFVRNLQEVKKVRKERGGLPGKKVEMPKKDRWQPRGERRDYNNKPYASHEKVYYGKSQWNSQSKAQEDEDRAKLM